MNLFEEPEVQTLGDISMVKVEQGYVPYMDAQVRFCKEHKIPFFAPMSGRCFRCKEPIFGEGGYSIAYMQLNHVTGCPRCHATFCD